MTWTLAITTLAGGFLGGLAGTGLTIVHERSSEQRRRMLDAAADFINTCERATVVLREGDQVAWVDTVQDATQTISSRLPMLVLLFGRESRPLAVATQIATAYWELYDMYAGKTPHDRERALALARRSGNDAMMFAQVASEQIRDSRTRRALRHVLR